MGDLKQLNLAKISELTTGSTDNFKKQVKELNLALKDLRALKEAEAAGKNRSDILRFLDKQINSENIAAYLGVAENDIGELNDILNEVNRIEDVEHFEEENIDIDQDQLIDLVGGTVSEMKEFIENNPLSAKQLEDLLNAEKRVKNRKTAKNYLEKEFRKKQVGKDVSKAQDDIEALKEDLEELKNDENIATDETDESEEDSEENQDEEQDETESEDNETDDNSEEPEESEEKDTDEDEKGDDEKDQDAEGEDDSEEAEELTEFEKKKEIAEDLELDMDENSLENYSLDDLKKIQSEKSHREELIELLEESGMDEEDLRNSSTKDLEKVAESLNEKEKSQEEHEEMREEAEEDLEMLMGAVRRNENNDEEDSKNTKEKLQDLKASIKDKLDRNSEEDDEKSSDINADRVEEVLDQYKELNDDEASIKTAHIMKGFLEQSLGIKREMTYKELAETMPTDDKSMEELAEFFLKMHREQYTGKFNVQNSNEIINTCEEVIQRLN